MSIEEYSKHILNLKRNNPDLDVFIENGHLRCVSLLYNSIFKNLSGGSSDATYEAILNHSFREAFFASMQNGQGTEIAHVLFKGAKDLFNGYISVWSNCCEQIDDRLAYYLFSDVTEPCLKLSAYSYLATANDTGDTGGLFALYWKNGYLSKMEIDEMQQIDDNKKTILTNIGIIVEFMLRCIKEIPAEKLLGEYLFRKYSDFTSYFDDPEQKISTSYLSRIPDNRMFDYIMSTELSRYFSKEQYGDMLRNAVSMRNHHAMNVLLQSGRCDVNSRDSFGGETPLLNACMGSYYYNSRIGGQMRKGRMWMPPDCYAIEALIKAGADITAEDDMKRNILDRMFYIENPALSYSFNREYKNELQYYPHGLHSYADKYAVKELQKAIVLLCSEYGMKIRKQTMYGVTPVALSVVNQFDTMPKFIYSLYKEHHEYFEDANAVKHEYELLREALDTGGKLHYLGNVLDLLPKDDDVYHAFLKDDAALMQFMKNIAVKAYYYYHKITRHFYESDEKCPYSFIKYWDEQVIPVVCDAAGKLNESLYSENQKSTAVSDAIVNDMSDKIRKEHWKHYKILWEFMKKVPTLYLHTFRYKNSDIKLVKDLEAKVKGENN